MFTTNGRLFDRLAQIENDFPYLITESRGQLSHKLLSNWHHFCSLKIAEQAVVAINTAFKA